MAEVAEVVAEVVAGAEEVEEVEEVEVAEVVGVKDFSCTEHFVMVLEKRQSLFLFEILPIVECV